jgi:hypothetical protein
MSDLADAIFGAQLTGHVIAGDELTSSLIHDAAMQADLSAALVGSDEMTGVEEDILSARVSQHIIDDGDYSQTDFMHDHLQSDLDASMIESLFT